MTKRGSAGDFGQFPLSASGYTVIEAVDGAESVAKAASERPDLVLMDIHLPVLDGYDANTADQVPRKLCRDSYRRREFLCHEGK